MNAFQQGSIGQMLAAQQQPAPMGPQQQAARDWHLSAERLEHARVAAARAQEELQAAEHQEREAWSTLEAVAGRAPQKATAYAQEKVPYR